jgi:fatty-acyl-CoA synthase
MPTSIASTMQDVPLSIATMVRYGTSTYADARITVNDGMTSARTSLGETGSAAARLANALRNTLNVGCGEPVATLMPNNLEHFQCYLAIPAMGSVLHTINVRYSAEQIARTAIHAEDRVIIVDSSLIGLLTEVLPSLSSVTDLVVVGDRDALGALNGCGKRVSHFDDLVHDEPDTYDWPELPESSAALMCYTSGTTGAPKGVVYSHRSVYLATMQLCMGDYLGLSHADTALVVVPMFHANSWNFPYAALMVGTSMVLPGRNLQAEHLVRLIEDERPTVSSGVPTVWTDILRQARESGADLSSLREVVIGGSACPRPLMEAFEFEFGVRLLHAWGMTEMSPYGSIAKPAGITGDAARELRMTQGRILGAVQARVVSADGQVLPNDGVSRGEIQTRGPWVTASYHRDPAADSFDDGWLRTGDIGTLSPDSVLTLSDRTKDIIKSGGEWISSLKLESVLHAHPAVVDAAVVGVKDDHWGERPWAIVVTTTGATVSVDELAAFVAGKVDKWQVPERWSVVDELPRNSVGKTDKAALRHLYSAQSVEVLNPSRRP